MSVQVPAQLESPNSAFSSRHTFTQSIGNATPGRRKDDHRYHLPQASNSLATAGEFMYAIPSLR
jgi:hypothetical protein